MCRGCKDCPCRFQENIALEARMGAIGDIIAERAFPTVICFQVHAHAFPVDQHSMERCDSDSMHEQTQKCLQALYC